MIKLKRGNLSMEVCTDVQASAFIRNGWGVVQEEVNEEANNVKEDKEDEKPKAEDEYRYSKSEISRMSTADLKALAPTLGIEVTEESTGAKLKEEIIAKLGL